MKKGNILEQTVFCQVSISRKSLRYITDILNLATRI